MASANSFSTTNPGSAVSNRENLGAGFYMIAPEDVPFTASLKKGPTLTARRMDWTCDDLSEIDDTVVSEGAKPGVLKDQGAKRARVFNTISTIQENFSVTDVQQRVNNAAVPDEVAFGIQRAITMLNLKVERAALSGDVRTVQDPSRAAGFSNMLSSTSTVFSDGAEAYRTPAALNKTAVAPTESAVNEIIQKLFELGNKTASLTAWVDTNWINRFVFETTRWVDATDNDNKIRVNFDGGSYEISSKVSVYKSQHGMVVFRDMNPLVSAKIRPQLDRALILNMEMCEMAEMRPLREQISKDGSGNIAENMKRYVSFCLRNGRAGALWNSIA